MDDETWTDGGLMRVAGETVSLREKREQDQFDGTNTYTVEAYMDGAWVPLGAWPTPPSPALKATRIALLRSPR